MLTRDLDYLAEYLARHLVNHSRLNKWRAELEERLWRQRALLKRRGFVGDDFEALVAEIEEFAFIEQHMAAEVARLRIKKAA